MAVPAVVNTYTNQLAGVSSDLTITLSSNPSVGNLLVVSYAIVGLVANNADPAISDNQGNTFTNRTSISVLFAGDSYFLRTGIFTAPVTTSSGSHTVTINPSGTSTTTYATAGVTIISGQASDFLDVVASGSGGVSPVSCALGARTYSETLAIGVMSHSLGTGGSITPPTDWTQIAELYEAGVSATGYPPYSLVYRAYTSTGTDNPSWSFAGSPLGVASSIVIKAAAALPRRALDGPFYGLLRGSVR